MKTRLLQCLLLAGHLFIAGLTCAVQAATTPWGADYFPNVPLIDQDGREVRFFDDLVEGRIVAVNFIYTRCADTCPLETAQLVKVQQILGDRLNRDVHFFSITIDPEHDSPEVLRAYRNRFGARWQFLTGKAEDITRLRRKLGLYIEEIQDGSNNHNVNMIIGNQRTGRWMKRSPFENPYVLADQLGNWLDGWRAPPHGPDYANAPRLRTITSGERLFRTRCASCHSLTGREQAEALGPDLLGVTERREQAWLLDWLIAPDKMLAARDPIALALYVQYRQLPMPNLRLTREEAGELIEYIRTESRRRSESEAGPAVHTAYARGAATASPADGRVITVSDAWIREANHGAWANGAYMTLVNPGVRDHALVYIESEAFESIEVHEMVAVDGLMRMREVESMPIPAGGRVALEPGGKHLMLIGPKKHFQSGESVAMTLVFDSGLRLTHAFPVTTGGRAD